MAADTDQRLQEVENGRMELVVVTKLAPPGPGISRGDRGASLKFCRKTSLPASKLRNYSKKMKTTVEVYEEEEETV